jgi:hypothetical protein
MNTKKTDQITDRFDKSRKKYTIKENISKAPIVNGTDLTYKTRELKLSPFFK